MCRGCNSLMIFISCVMTVCILLRREKLQYCENNIYNFCNTAYFEKHDTATAARSISIGVFIIRGGKPWYLTIFDLKMYCYFELGLAFFEPAFISVQSAFRQRKQEKSHSAAVHSSGPYSLDHTKSPFWGRHFMCCVVGSAGEKDLLCLFGTVLDAVHALLVEAVDLLQLGDTIR